MTIILATAAVAIAAAAVAVAALAVCMTAADRRAIRAARTGMDAPVPYWPAEDAEILGTDALLLALTCGPCRDDAGDCTCSSQCGELACMGGFSDDDIAFLQSLSMPEGTDQ